MAAFLKITSLEENSIQMEHPIVHFDIFRLRLLIRKWQLASVAYEGRECIEPNPDYARINQKNLLSLGFREVPC
jgi:hypothetical protein